MSRISQEFITEFNHKFTESVARQYQQQHQLNCHHWDFTFLLWHRKFIGQFWQQLDLPPTYAVLTQDEDRQLYRQLRKSLVLDNAGNMMFVEDNHKLNSLTGQDLAQIELDIAEAMVCNRFAIDLDFEGSNRDRFAYNLSFSSQVEEFHDMIHGETGRGMRSVSTAGGDQCFFIHHTFVDLVFETWLDEHPDMALPISQDHFDTSPDLQQDYQDYGELVDLWQARHFSFDDYKHVRRITAPITRQAIVFDRIAHTEDFRRVIMFHGQDEIGRFAILTGRIETCLTCARRQAHSGQFLLRRLVPVSEIMWNINNQWFTWDSAIDKFDEIGMSVPYVVSF
ncbi:tyrosinase family protein [Motilimonas pumila]|nr:tyrosinase family protein [Motilimonas pumila]